MNGGNVRAIRTNIDREKIIKFNLSSCAKKRKSKKKQKDLVSFAFIVQIVNRYHLSF